MCFAVYWSIIRPGSTHYKNSCKYSQSSIKSEKNKGQKRWSMTDIWFDYHNELLQCSLIEKWICQDSQTPFHSVNFTALKNLDDSPSQQEMGIKWHS